MHGFERPPEDQVTRLGEPVGAPVRGEDAGARSTPVAARARCVPPAPLSAESTIEEVAAFAREYLCYQRECAEEKERKARQLQESTAVQQAASYSFVPEAEAQALDAAAGFVPSDDQVKAMRDLLAAFQQPGIYQLRGAAGCHPAGTMLLLASGEKIAVEDVQEGMRLLGMDGRPRSVQHLIRGRGPLFRIHPVKGAPFDVNDRHVLTLVGSKHRTIAGKLIDVEVRELTPKLVQNYKLFRVGMQEFKYSTAPALLLPPYFMGIFLGDGGAPVHGSVGISKPDAEIEQAVRDVAAGLNMRVSQSGPATNPTWFIVAAEGRPQTNPLRTALECYGLRGKTSGGKFIPAPYLTASWQDRCDLLAGLLDTDGHYERGGYDYISKSKQLAEDVCFVARSLGLAAYLTPCKKGCQNGFVGDYFRVSISGDCTILPLRIPRKQPQPRRQSKNVLRTGIKKIEPLGEGAFYGFTLDGDGRYLLDDFTVTHNSGKTSAVRALLRRLPASWEVVLLAPTWAAANRLTALSGRRAVSLHRFLYGRPREARQCELCQVWAPELLVAEGRDVQEELNGEMVVVTRPHYTCPGCKHVFRQTSHFPDKLVFPARGDPDRLPKPRIIAIDEASMLSQAQRADVETFLLDAHTRVLLIGDPNQIPPVSTPDAPEEEIEWGSPTASLDHIHRQAAGNPTLALAHTHKTYPRPDTLPEWPFPRQWRGDPRLSIQYGSADDIAYWHAGLRHQGRHVVSIALSNAMRAEINYCVRGHLGLRAAAAAQDAPVTRGDRLLMRANCLAGDVYNSELHIVCAIERVPPGTRFLNAASRCAQQKTGTLATVEANETLGSTSIGVWHVETWPVHGSPEERRRGYIVAGWFNGGWALESDYLRAGGADDRRARTGAREIVKTWRQEYKEGVSTLKSQWEAERSRIAECDAALRGLAKEGILSGTVHRLVGVLIDKLSAFDKVAAKAKALELHAKGDFNGLAEMFNDDRLRYCADALTVEEYAERRYQAIPTPLLWQVDYGECATGHAMQGSQAEFIAVACDKSFWGQWKHNRIAAMRWLYTAETRTSHALALFRLPYVAAT